MRLRLPGYRESQLTGMKRQPRCQPDFSDRAAGLFEGSKDLDFAARSSIYWCGACPQAETETGARTETALHQQLRVMLVGDPFRER